jgi:hypothetical protein
MKKHLKKFLEFTTVIYETNFVGWTQEDPRKALSDLGRLMSARESWWNRGISHFVNPILTTRSWEAKEPLHRAYALLSLSLGSDSVFRSEIIVEYSTYLKVSDIYVQFGKLALYDEEYLELLEHTNSKEPLPTTLS